MICKQLTEFIKSRENRQENYLKKLNLNTERSLQKVQMEIQPNYGQPSMTRRIFQEMQLFNRGRQNMVQVFKNITKSFNKDNILLKQKQKSQNQDSINITEKIQELNKKQLIEHKQRLKQIDDQKIQEIAKKQEKEQQEQRKREILLKICHKEKIYDLQYYNKNLIEYTKPPFIQKHSIKKKKTDRSSKLSSLNTYETLQTSSILYVPKKPKQIHSQIQTSRNDSVQIKIHNENMFYPKDTYRSGFFNDKEVDDDWGIDFYIDKIQKKKIKQKFSQLPLLQGKILTIEPETEEQFEEDFNILSQLDQEENNL